jgi:hypothetical protein
MVVIIIPGVFGCLDLAALRSHTFDVCLFVCLKLMHMETYHSGGIDKSGNRTLDLKTLLRSTHILAANMYWARDAAYLSLLLRPLAADAGFLRCPCARLCVPLHGDVKHSEVSHAVGIF